MIEILLIIFVYNENVIIKKIVSEFDFFMWVEMFGCSFEIIVIDDGFIDGMVDWFVEIVMDNFKVVCYFCNCGCGVGV